MPMNSCKFGGKLVETNNESIPALPSRKNRLNELDGRRWTRYSISIWQINKTPSEAKLKHPAMFPIELCSRLIDIYTKKGDVVLDPFMGSGSTLVAAKDKERRAIGFDVNPSFVTLARRRLSQQKLIQQGIREAKVYCDDSRNLLEHLEPSSVDFVLTSPPYWNIHSRKRTADYKESRPYSDLKSDIGNTEEFKVFMDELQSVFERVHTVLKHGKRCAVVVMDIRLGSQFIPFHIDVIDAMKKVGFVLEDIIIWDRKQEYSNLRPLGYPYVFIVNKIHEYVLLFRKNKEEVVDDTETD
jgi:DNA modification methylase